MIRIDWRTLDSIGQEYVKRLMDHAQDHPKCYLNKKVLKVIGPHSFRDLILCPPHRLRSYVCPAPLVADNVYSVYDSFFCSSGRDKVNNADWLLEKLDIKVCPYCNRSYTFTIKGRQGVRPELDHFYPRSIPAYRHLAISFYNLVPSCPVCNRQKWTSVFDFHPYYGMVDGSERMPKLKINDSNVSYDANHSPILFPDKPEIKLENPNTNTSVLKLESLYKHHSDYAKEILDKILAYNSALYIPLVSAFQGMGRTPEEIDRLIWGNYIADAEQAKRPLSKLTKDILSQFGIK